MDRTPAFLALLLTAFVAPAACKDPPPPAVPTVSPDASAEPPPAVDPDAGATSPAPPEGTNLVEVALDAAIDLGLNTQAAQAAPGMTPVGAPGRATLTEGEHFGMMVNLEPNKCYTVLGFSPTGQVTELDLKLMAPPLFNIQAGASGANEKNQPVIGKGKAALCPFLPVAIAYKLDVTAKKGAGRIGVQLYERIK